jgi:HD domain
MAHARSADDSTDSRALAAATQTASVADGQDVLIATLLTMGPVSKLLDTAPVRSPRRPIRSSLMLAGHRIPQASQSFPKTLAALAYAHRLHAGQRRQADGAPFILHPVEVAGLLDQAGAPDDVIAAGVLHDTIEKTDATAADLRTRFGWRIATLVLAVSEDERIIGYSERKAALREAVASAGREALMVLAADKISKAREMGLESKQTRQSRVQPALARASRDRKLAHYRCCLDLLEQLLTDSPLVTQLRTELENAPGIPNTPPLLPGAPHRLASRLNQAL